MKPRVFFYVQHLLGIGHVRRAATLARALASAGFDVLLVSGGAPLALDLGRARLHQLPPLRARDEGLRELSRLDGTPLDETFKAARTRELLELLRAESPAILVTEQFPFGRTQLRFELLPLLEAARALRPRPLLVASVRDVVRRTMSAERVAQTLELFRSFDLALVHGDPRLVPFERSFAGWAGIRDRAVYTGYVAEADGAAATIEEGRGDVVVSAGGGAVGRPLLDAAVEARSIGPLGDRRWRLLVGDNLPAAARAALPADPGIVVEPARPDFRGLLRNACLSISQAGYNTVVETLCCADRAVLVPFASERETEQLDRAELLAERGLVAVVSRQPLTGESLAAGIRSALGGPSLRSFPAFDLGGATATAEILRRHLS
ncbi:MAG: glycosyltransferase [Enhydrobacter sp.]|nr:MAG: glycosyltransferase [Enhydrobacter sp.]